MVNIIGACGIKMKNFIISCVLTGFALALLILLIGCSGVQVKYTEPIIPVRPNLTFNDCQIIRVSTDKYICLSLEEMRTLFAYVLQTEMELAKCSVTIKEINK